MTGITATKRSTDRLNRVRREFVIALLVVVASFSIVMLVRALQRPEPLERAAHKVLTALLEGDAKTLMKYVTPQEREATGLNERTLQEVLDRVYLPVFGGCKLEETHRWEYSSDTHYFIEGTVTCRNGKRMLVGAEVDFGDTHVCRSLVFVILTEVVAARARQEYPELDSSLAHYKAFRDLKPILGTLQLKKVWVNFKHKALSWDEIEARYRQQAEQAGSQLSEGSGR